MLFLANQFGSVSCGDWEAAFIEGSAPFVNRLNLLLLLASSICELLYAQVYIGGRVAHPSSVCRYCSSESGVSQSLKSHPESAISSIRLSEKKVL